MKIQRYRIAAYFGQYRLEPDKKGDVVLYKDIKDNKKKGKYIRLTSDEIDMITAELTNGNQAEQFYIRDAQDDMEDDERDEMEATIAQRTKLMSKFYDN